MGEKESEPFQFTFNGFLKVAFQGSRVTSDAGLILVRELDERLGLEAIITEHLSDSRHGLNTQFLLPDLLRQSIYSRLAGYEDLNDAARLSTDPTFRLIGSPKRWNRSAALTSTLHWFETEATGQRGEPRRADGRKPRSDWAGRDPGPIRPHRARHGFQREPGAWAARGWRLQRALRVGLLPSAVSVQRSLTSLQQRLVKTGGRLVKHSRVLPAPAGREPPDSTPVRVDASADLGAARADRLIGERCRRPWAKRGRKAGEVSVRHLERRQPRVTIRAAERVFRGETPPGRNPDPSARW